MIRRMLNIKPTYNLNESAGSMPVVYHSKVKESRVNMFVASALLAASVATVSLQAGFVMNANATGNPISSPVSTQESPTPSPSASSNPVTSPEVSPSPTNNTNNGGGTPSNNNGGGNSGGSSNNSGGSSAPSCNNEAPKAPKIVSAVTTGKNEITLKWEKPVSGNVSHYSVSYGLLKGKPLYGNANVGNVTSFKVAGLAGGVTYYFTVKAVNDCTPSAASNEVAMKVGGKFINTPAVGFKPAVLGKTEVKQSINKPALAKPVVFNTTVETKPVNIGLVGKVASFFKNIF